MDIKRAYEIANSVPPKPEDMVDLECSCCTCQFASIPEGVYEMGDNKLTKYRFFVGGGNITINSEDLSKKYTCPNGCMTGYFKDKPSMLYDIHESGGYTPHEEYECAVLTVKLDSLEDEVREMKEQLKHYSNIEY